MCRKEQVWKEKSRRLFGVIASLVADKVLQMNYGTYDDYDILDLRMGDVEWHCILHFEVA